jgi:hypothetical protein
LRYSRYDAATDTCLLALHTPTAQNRCGVSGWAPGTSNGGAVGAEGCLRTKSARFSDFRVERSGDGVALMSEQEAAALCGALDLAGAGGPADASAAAALDNPAAFTPPWLAAAAERSVTCFPADDAIFRFSASADAGVWASVFTDDNVIGLRHNYGSGAGAAAAALAIEGAAGEKEQVRGAKAFKAMGALLSGKGNPGAPPDKDKGGSWKDKPLPKHGAAPEATFVATLRAAGGVATRLVVDAGPARPRKPDGLGTVRVAVTLPHGTPTRQPANPPARPPARPARDAL